MMTAMAMMVIKKIGNDSVPSGYECAVPLCADAFLWYNFPATIQVRS